MATATVGVQPRTFRPVWRRAARELRRALLDLLLPPECAVCGESASELCQPCTRQLAWRPRQACRRCGAAARPLQTTCGGDHRELRGIDRLVAPWHFAGSGGALVRRFKLDGQVAAGRLIVRAMANAWLQAGGEGWRRACLTSVPLHRTKLRQRGFDQAAWLAAETGPRIGLGVLSGVLHRTHQTLPQGDPRVVSRSNNVAGAFTVRHPDLVRGRAVLLVDDVVTSGATVRECARVLRQAGATAVAVLVACRS